MTTDITPATLFSDLHLSEAMQHTLKKIGFKEASPIQKEAIPLLMAGFDILGQAETGTGKTAAFAIPLIEQAKPKTRHTQILVLCPTRELAFQVAKAFDQLLSHLPKLRATALVGGESMTKQIRFYRRNPAIVVGTPGRVLDMLRQEVISFHQTKQVVLDEADEMLDMGFRKDIEAILNTLPKKRQSILMSATMSAPIKELAQKYLHNPTLVKTAQDNASSKNVHQHYVPTDPGNRRRLLNQLVNEQQLHRGIIFCNTKRQVDKVSGLLEKDGLNVSGLHGGMSQGQRNRVMKKFRSGKTSFLVATDVAARGIDVKDIEVVFNYDFPQSNESYVHRIGRTGRAQREGMAFTFVTRREQRFIKKLEKHTNSKIARTTIAAG